MNTQGFPMCEVGFIDMIEKEVRDVLKNSFYCTVFRGNHFSFRIKKDEVVIQALGKSGDPIQVNTTDFLQSIEKIKSGIGSDSAKM